MTTSAPTLTEAIALAAMPPKPHYVEHEGASYVVHLPAHATDDTKGYYARLLTNRIELGLIPATATHGIIAGSYNWERTK